MKNRIRSFLAKVRIGLVIIIFVLPAVLLFIITKLLVTLADKIEGRHARVKS
jgi:hypothetical protein